MTIKPVTGMNWRKKDRREDYKIVFEIICCILLIFFIEFVSGTIQELFNKTRESMNKYFYTSNNEETFSDR